MAFPNARAAVAALADRSATLEDLREIVTAFPALRPVVAAYPDTDEGLLGWLRELNDPVVDAQLAKRHDGAVPEPAPPAASTQPMTPVAETPAVVPRDAAATEAIPFTPARYGPIAGYAAATAPAPIQQPTAPEDARYAPAEPTRKRRALPVILIVVAALVVVGGGVGAAFATGLIGGLGGTPTTSSRPSATATRAVTASPSTSPTVTASSSSPTPTTSAPVAATGFTCWDGTAVTALSDCKSPSGKDAAWRYLKYVYPSSASHTTCKKSESASTAYTGVTVMWECELGEAMIRYRYWENVSDADMHYSKKFDSKTTRKAYDLLVGGEPTKGWVKTDRDSVTGPGGVKRLVVTMWLPAEHLSLSVEGNTTKAMWAAFNQVTTRPVAQSLGYTSSEVPVEAPLTALAR